jgi:DNA repair protein RadD
MSMVLRPYQERVLDSLWDWFSRHEDGEPVVVAAVGAGKSLMIAAVAQRMHQAMPGARVLVLMHQKELLEQNVDKMSKIWPEANVGIFSASKGRKDLGCQITYATIGSIWKQAHRLGRIDMVMADECHLINTKQQGMWRSFLADLARFCPGARTVGWTGTDFRGNGVFLTAGKEALFTHCAAKITMRELLDLGYLTPLKPALTEARVDSDDVPTSGDDYVVHELAKVTDTDELVQATASEICTLFSDRKRWLVFAVTVEHATHMRDALRDRGVSVDIVSAETPKAEREEMIARFRDGRLRCLVNVAVLTTGFDVPELDAIALLRATKSPVLYVQIAGRGMRLADGKTDCLWADFTDTTSRLGPVDEIKGRMPVSRGSGDAPFKLCPNCGSRNLAAATECLDCGHQFPKPELIKHGREARGAAVLSDQRDPVRDIDVDRVTYEQHIKHGRPDSMRIEYWRGPTRIATEWQHFDADEREKYLRLKAEAWWAMRRKLEGLPRTSADAVTAARNGAISQPHGITIDTREKYPKITGYRWDRNPNQQENAA